MSSRLKLIFGLIAVVITACAGSIGFVAQRHYSQAAETEAELFQLITKVERWDTSCSDHFVDSLQQASRLVQDHRFFGFQEPTPFCAYIESGHEGDPPVLCLYWLENEHAVDGFDVLVDGRLRHTISGWTQEQDDELNEHLFGNRYMRFAFVDVGGSTPNDRDLVDLDIGLPHMSLEIQLRTRGNVSQRIPVFIAPELIGENND